MIRGTKCYLCAILDLFSRNINLVKTLLLILLKARNEPIGLMFHEIKVANLQVINL